MVNRIILLFLLLVSPQLLQAQVKFLRGEVVDVQSGEPLAFVSIAVVGNTRHGTTTDIDGKFRILLPAEEKVELVFSYVGYENQKYTWFTASSDAYIKIELEEKLTNLREVVVESGENPAYKIIRRVVQNRHHNDPFELPSFSYHSYNKMYATLAGMATESHEFRNGIEGDSLLAKSYLFLSESYTKRALLAPNLSKETVLANRMSGYRDPAIAMVASDFQPLSFYEEIITFFGQEFLNPISKGSGRKYIFLLEDTFLRGGDSTFVVSFEPRPGKNFNGLKGTLSINSKGYAIESVIAESTAEHQMLGFTIQQKYGLVTGRWFPVQLNTDFIHRGFDVKGKNLLISSRSYLSYIRIAPELQPEEFSHVQTKIADDANRREEQVWQDYRTDSLSEKERNTYQLYESLDPKKKAFLNGYMLFLEGMMLNSFKVGKVSITGDQLYRFNGYEGNSFGLGLETNEDFSRLFTIGGYVGYGLRDKALKYGGTFGVNIFPRAEAKLLFSYRKDISEPGAVDFFNAGASMFRQDAFRSWIRSRMDSVEEVRGAFRFRAFKFFEVEASLTNEKRNPTYPYQYFPEGEILNGGSSSFAITEAGLGFRYAVGERYTQIGRGEVVLQPARTVFTLYAGKGLNNNMLGGDYGYSRIVLKAVHAFYSKGVGETMVQLTTGLMTGSLPLPYLQTGQGSLSNSWYDALFIPAYFQTMGLYEFLSDRYAYLFLNHNFGQLLYKSESKYFHPELVLVQHVGYGSLKNPEHHSSIFFRRMEKGYLESGLLINNLLRISYVDLFYVGLGGGIFYRYGAYALPDRENNMALKASVKVSF